MLIAEGGRARSRMGAWKLAANKVKGVSGDNTAAIKLLRHQ